jgi:hypothetical protein
MSLEYDPAPLGVPAPKAASSARLSGMAVVARHAISMRRRRRPKFQEPARHRERSLACEPTNLLKQAIDVERHVQEVATLRAKSDLGRLHLPYRGRTHQYRY